MLQRQAVGRTETTAEEAGNPEKGDE
jgi:hypothetical protein